MATTVALERHRRVRDAGIGLAAGTDAPFGDADPWAAMQAAVTRRTRAGATIGEVIDNLETAFPGIKERVCDEAGNVRRFVNIYVGGEDIRFLEDKATAVKEADEISIVPAIAGG